MKRPVWGILMLLPSGGTAHAGRAATDGLRIAGPEPHMPLTPLRLVNVRNRCMSFRRC